MMSINQAAINFNLPYSSLYGRFKRGKFDAALDSSYHEDHQIDQSSENSVSFRISLSGVRAFMISKLSDLSAFVVRVYIGPSAAAATATTSTTFTASTSATKRSVTGRVLEGRAKLNCTNAPSANTF